MKDFIENGKVIDIILDDDRVVKVSTDYINNMIKNLDIDKEEALLTWLEDEEYLINDEQEELVAKAKENRTLASLHRNKDNKPKQKTQRERVVKENPTKEMVIAEIAKLLPNFAENVVIANKGKLITFTIGDNDYKIDLVQKRKKKEN
jgi:hypothetical protein